MPIQDWIPFWPDRRTYFVPWVQFRTEEGSDAEGPMMRRGTGRQEILVWTQSSEAERAALDLVAQTGGRFEIKTVDRKGLWAQCRQYASWGSRVVAVIIKAGE